ncbi:MAG: response regulator transcription factor [Chitinophagaceae bacterium]|nr:response regulator transcription factor [Chitinophagaceae bacterium]
MLKAVLIDDEETSLNSLRQKIINHCPQVEIMAVCTKAGEGLKAIDELYPDLVFLDIQMPIMNGFTLLKKVKYKNFELIFVTAYDHYAIKAIKCSALDYLVKPVEVEELVKAVEKAVEKKENYPNKRLELLLENALAGNNNFRRIAISSYEGLYFIKMENIVYLEASGNYTNIFTQDRKKYLSSRSLKDFEELLSSSQFIRIHNSYIINKDFVERYIRGEGGQVVMEGNITLDISKRRKSDFLNAIGM